ncbi:MAG: hypothetical protein K0S07_1148, partial [Chlamydiales bacterium]|nr:hypothetical protein [Chlamydiales bacterium]
NAAAAIYVSGLANTLNEGLEMAKRSVNSGRAFDKLQTLIALSQQRKKEASISDKEALMR